jgi:predicted Rossmann fold nucleotide-binding protein DprA/Smf involved in DNA uptake
VNRPESVRLAVVGSTRFAHDMPALGLARDLIVRAVEFYRPDVVISGGAVGIDQLAAEVAGACGIELVEHLPSHQRWQPDGFKARNLAIAHDCTHLLCVRHRASTTYGSGWTADRAQQLGRTVHRRVI